MLLYPNNPLWLADAKYQNQNYVFIISGIQNFVNSRNYVMKNLGILEFKAVLDTKASLICKALSSSGIFAFEYKSAYV